ncbi:helix-turn-helix domain-containing protein [Marinifilum sp. D737]|uniref:helix-turn-helix domain-containing protein n=1 Tax=Marinifilum sp. D737 TaxID=2969628 RepID=UPI002273DF25|nr:helix-turn-helix domain-containing protein [Marinifilum sp. D737]MCY1636596.1 helix-turn-helix domain-containing protein [Marinifilum sp. D737]
MHETILLSIQKDELKAIIKESVSDTLKSISASKTENANLPVYLTRKETANLLRISLPTLHSLTRLRRLSVIRVGGKVLYHRDEILQKVISLGGKKMERRHYGI